MGKRNAFTKIFVIILVVFIIIIGAFGAFMYFNTARTMRNQLGSKCIGLASAVAVLIEEDIEGYKAFTQTLDMDSKYYRDIKQKLEYIRYGYGNDGSIAFLYTEARISETEMMYVLDAELPHALLFSPPGKVDTLTASELAAYDKKAAYIPDAFVENSYGSLLTCYVPIFDRSMNEFVGLVGADVSKDQYNAVMSNQLLIILGSIFFLILLVTITLALSSGRVERMITLDPLTGVYNKAYFMRDLRYQIRHTARKGGSMTVFMADLDHFKNVNDKYGHPFGDLVLEAVAKTIACSLRKTDCLARYGGEEFTAYLADMDALFSRSVLERIRKAVEATRVYNEETKEYVGVTISIGAVEVLPGRSAADVIRQADRALYAAKKTRNQVAYYGDEPLEQLSVPESAPFERDEKNEKCV